MRTVVFLILFIAFGADAIPATVDEAANGWWFYRSSKWARMRYYC